LTSAAHSRLIVLGLQHLFIMYAGAVAVPLIVGPAVGLDGSDIAVLVSADLFGLRGRFDHPVGGHLQDHGGAPAGGGRRNVHRAQPMIVIANQYGGRDGLPTCTAR